MTTLTTGAKSISYDRDSRDYRAEYEGELLGYFGTYHDAEVALDYHESELLRQTAIDTADMEADAAAQSSTKPSLLIERDVMDAATAAHILGEINGAHAILESEEAKQWLSPDACEAVLTEWQAVIDRKRAWLATYGYMTRLSSRSGAYVPSGGGSWTFVSGERCDPPVSDPDPLPPWTECKACGGTHSIQVCPEIRAKLFARAIVAPDLLAEADAVLAAQSFGIAA